MTALIQNFSIPADNDVQVTLTITPVEALDAATVYWQAYNQQFGIPDFDLPSPSGAAAVIQKSTLDGSITLLSPPSSCAIQINRSDTVELLRNYYHETTLVDSSGNVSTLNQGIMTVTDTRIRP